MSTTTQFVVLFVGAVSLLFALGFFAVWAEFNSSAKKHEYTRYPHFKPRPAYTGKVYSGRTAYKWSQA